MLDGRPDSAGGRRTPQRLILPNPNAAYPPPDKQTQRGHVHMANVPHSRPMLAMPTMPPNSMKKRNWRKDPAFIVLLAAVCVVLLGGITFAAFASTIFFPGTTSNTSNLKTVVTPQGTIDTQPIFPTPGGNQSATPPAVQPTQTKNGPLTVQIDNPPAQVPNNITEAITITTSNPNTPVKLVVSYSVPPYFASIGTQMTDANGNATLFWHVDVHASPHHHTTTAHLTVTCGDEQKMGTVSKSFFVQILR